MVSKREKLHIFEKQMITEIHFKLKRYLQILVCNQIKYVADVLVHTNRQKIIIQRGLENNSYRLRKLPS